MAKIKAKKSEDKSDIKVNRKKLKEPKIRTEEGETLHRFIIIFIVIIVAVIIIYLISALVSKKEDNNNTNNTVAEAEIDYDIVSVGTILNRNQYDKYYVMVYDADSINAFYYSTLIAQYNEKEEHVKIFFCDLSNPLNKEYASETSNPKAQKVEDFAFGEVTLLEVQKGRVTRYIEDIETIEEILQ